MPTTIDRNTLQRLVADGAQLVEVLPPNEYEEEHLPGAMSLPLRQLLESKRLETLGFEEVHHYTPGKEDWMAAGLPIEGSKASIPRVGIVARRDVPTCRLDERLGDVSARVLATGWDLCVVLNERNIVLGRLKRAALEGDADAIVGSVMEPGPVTYRPHVVAADAARTLAERHIQSVLGPGLIATSCPG